jgi:hypothetical protein
MTATRHPNYLAPLQALCQVSDTALRDEQITITHQNERRCLNAPESFSHVVRFNQAKPVRHHALISLPALPGYKLKQGIGSLAAAKEQVEELIDEGIIRWQWVPR